MDKGFVIMAQGEDYVKCAKYLESSIKYHMPDTSVTIITTDMLPYGDQAPDTNWKLQNDWQVYEASPYEHTIKLEADMLITRPIDYWFNVLQQKDIVVSTTIRNFKQEIYKEGAYRRFLQDNNLPDVYNAITYFKKSDNARYFFSLVREIFENWEEFKKNLQCNPKEICTTDWAYSIACHIMGVENTTMSKFTDMSMIHMKMLVNGLPTENWTDTLIHELFPNTLRVNTYPQMYPFHYHIKNFVDTIDKTLYAK